MMELSSAGETVAMKKECEVNTSAELNDGVEDESDNSMNFNNDEEEEKSQPETAISTLDVEIEKLYWSH